MLKYKGILFLMFFIFSLALFAQVDNEKKPFLNILLQLQEKYNYQFSYADDIIHDIFIVSPSVNFTIKQTINYLRKKTGLQFEFLENNFIVITLKDNSFFVCGYIIDNEAKSPLEAVSVIGKDNATITNSFGYFQLKVSNKNEDITIRHLGFNPVSQLASSFDLVNCSYLYLLPKTEVLQEIVLANFIAKGIDKIADGSFNINFSNFDILPGLIETDVLQTVQALPGILSIDETVSNINIRGGTNDQNLILWDGIKMYQSGHFFGLISIFNPLTTSDVSVIKNGTNVDLSDGVSGSILMKTDTKINNTFSGSIGANFINVDGFVDIPLGEKASLQIASRKGIREFVETSTYNNYFERIEQDTEIQNIIEDEKQFDFYDVSFRLLFQITDKDFLRVSALLVNNELVFNESALINQQEESKESSLMQNSISEGVFYKRNWSDKFTTTLNVYETDYNLKAINSDIVQQQRLVQKNEVSETSIRLNTIYKYSPQLSFLNGYQYTDTGITNLTDVDNPVIVRSVKEVISEHALYSQVNYISNSKQTSIKVGARYNFVEEFEKHIIEPRVVFNQKFLNDFNVELSGELKHQNTSQIINLQNDFLGIEKRRWRLSNNDDVPIIKSKQVSLGLSYTNKGWLINTEGYFKDVDGITSQSQGFLGEHKFDQEIGTYQITGIDFLFNKRIQKFSTWLSYSYANNLYTFKTFSETKFPNNVDIQHAVSFGTSFSSNNLKISGGFNWHSGRPITKPVLGNEIFNGTINYEKVNSSRLNDYLRTDVSAMYNFKLTDDIRVNTGISIWNLLDRENIITSFYRINNNAIEQVSKNSLGFTTNFTLRVEFE